RRGLADLAGLGWNWLDLAGRFRRRPQLNNSQSVRATASAKSAALSTKNNRSRVGSITMMPISCRPGLRWRDARVSIAHAKLLSSRANTPLRTDCAKLGHKRRLSFPALECRKGQLLQPLSVPLAAVGELDDLFGDKFGQWVKAIDQAKRVE